MTRLPASLLLFVLTVGFTGAATRMVIVPSEETLEGWISTRVVPGTGCIPADVNSGNSLRAGREASDDCTTHRAFLSFPLDQLQNHQTVSGALIFYQTTLGGNPLPQGTLLRVDWIDAGENLDWSDWNAVSIAQVARVPAHDETGQFRIDISTLLSFAQDTGRDRMDLRIRLDSENTATGFLEIASGSSPIETRARLELAVTDTVVTPASYSPSGSNPAGQELVASDTFIGLALANPNPAANRAKVDYFAKNGSPVVREDQGLVPKQGQRAIVIDPPPDADMLSAWGNNGALQGFFMLGTNELNWLDGIGSSLDPVDELYFPCLPGASADNTQLFLFETASTAEQIVRIETFRASGTLQGSRAHNLSAPGTLSGTVRSLTGGASCPGYLRVVAPNRARGFQTITGTSNLAALPGLVPQRTNRLYAPHFLLAQDATSQIQVLNLEVSPVTVLVRVFLDDGSVLSESEVTVNPRSLAGFNLEEMVDRSGLVAPLDSPLSGHLELSVTEGFPGGARMAGTISFGEKNGAYRSVLPLVGEGRLETLVLQVAQSNEFRIFTGLALLNIGGLSQVKVEAYDRGGHLTGSQELELEPNRRLVDLLNGPEYFGNSFSQVGGHLRILSNSPLVTFAIFGDYDLAYLSAIESQGPLNQFRDFGFRAGLCEGNPGPSLVHLDPDPRTGGPITLGPGPTEIEVRFWDDSRVPSPLGGFQRGVTDVQWSLSELEAIGILPTTTLLAGNFPYAVVSRLRFTVPEGTVGKAVIQATALDVEGCTSTLEFTLHFEAP